MQVKLTWDIDRINPTLMLHGWTTSQMPVCLINDSPVTVYNPDTEPWDPNKIYGKWDGVNELLITNLRIVYANDTIEFNDGGAPPVGWTGRIVGVTNPAKVNGIAVANISKITGV